ncbi:hypothetical protein E1B28_010854 [Marasmius oreades]|uniref:Uncharacterized protein n=1 Tax=Marasmius oreades TaxID=181124 RepID=A0A9P7UPD5_9AGAR|nr:uncharacterized protein E1B28_010854 [Marasmius oreades]KAG7089148.1 hypothetical protein E1B28_010854 [Marasmius oreades]
MLAPPPSPPPVRPSGLPERKRQLPTPFRHHDPLPEAVPATTAAVTICNKFGLYCKYQHRPSYNPDSSVPFDDLANQHPHSDEQVEQQNVEETNNSSPPWPFNSMAVHQLMSWMNTGSSAKTYGELDRLANIISSPDFDANDLIGFSAKRESQRLDTAKSEDCSGAFINGFTKTSVDIEVPSGQKGVPLQKFTVQNLLYRDLLDTIKLAFSHPLSLKFHLSPFKLFHVSDEQAEPMRVYSELYNSDSFIKEHDKVQRADLPSEETECKRECVVAAMMFWSDATQLANFGDAKLWPIYLFFGNLLKYISAQPRSGACHHIAYISSVS